MSWKKKYSALIPQEDRGLSEKQNRIPCDSIFLSTGEIVVAKVEEVGIETVKYNHCDGANSSGTVARSEVVRIRYSNGSEDQIGAYPTTPHTRPVNSSTSGESKVHPLATTAMVLAFVGIGLSFLGGYGIFAFLASFVLSLIPLRKIKQFPDLFWGAGRARLALILSSVAIAAYLIALGIVIYIFGLI